jgi:hypothetical protein
LLPKYNYQYNDSYKYERNNGYDKYPYQNQLKSSSFQRNPNDTYVYNNRNNGSFPKSEYIRAEEYPFLYRDEYDHYKEQLYIQEKLKYEEQIRYEELLKYEEQMKLKEQFEIYQKQKYEKENQKPLEIDNNLLFFLNKLSELQPITNSEGSKNNTKLTNDEKNYLYQNEHIYGYENQNNNARDKLYYEKNLVLDSESRIGEKVNYIHSYEDPRKN